MFKRIATFHSPFKEKFGIPRQAGLIEGLPGYISFEKPYDNPEAIRGLEDFDYIWIIWQSRDTATSLTVRPPRLGGNKRMGVFATRSPFRPNPLCLSCVKIHHIEQERCIIHVVGADILDGTAILDIKPYIPYSDAHPEARGGFTDNTQWQTLNVDIPQNVAGQCTRYGIPTDILQQILSQDPRPHFHNDPERIYGMTYKDCEVKFRVADGTAHVLSVTEKPGKKTMC